MLRSKIGKVDNTAVEWGWIGVNIKQKILSFLMANANNKTRENYLAHLYSVYSFSESSCGLKCIPTTNTTRNR